jgi:uncharacterized protein YfaS (alpha-2-macroglobulin family)
MYRHAPVCLVFALALVSCLRGPPDVAPSAHLGPSATALVGHTKPPLAVAFAGPRGLVANREEPAITVLFNRAMRTLETADDAGLPAIRVETAEGRPIAGTARWLGTHGLLFLPDAPLPAATSFAVTVPAGVPSIDGDRLTLPYRFELSTAPPSLVASTPPEGAGDVRPNASISLVFNQAVDPSVVERSAKLTIEGKEAPFHATRTSPPAPKIPAERQVTVTPGAPLPLDRAVVLTLSAGLRGAEGPLPMKEARPVAMRTYGPLRLANFNCPKVGLGRCQAHRDVTVILSNAVTLDQLRAHTRTTMPKAPPPPPAKPQDGQRPSPAGKVKKALADHAHPLGVDPQPGNRYRVTLTAGMRDIFGQTLAKDVSFDVDTEAPFAAAPQRKAARSEPQPAPPPPEPEDDSRPRRPELTYQAALGVQGDLLEATAAPPGMGHKLPVGVVNLPTYGLSTTALVEADAVRWLAGEDRDGPHGDGWRWDWISPGVPENVRSVRTVDLDALLRATPGARMALVGLAIPGVGESPQTAALGVTDLAVTARVSRYGSLLWVTRLSTGAPVGGAAVVLRTLKRELFSTTTDPQGIAIVPQSAIKPIGDGGSIDRETWVVARAGGDWVAQRLDRSAADVRAAPEVDLSQKGDWEGIVFTDRGVYRPGETIKLSALVRRSDAAGLKVPPPTDLRVEVKDAQDDRVYSGHALTDAFGEVALDVPIPRTSHLGQAVVMARVGRGGGDAFSTNVTLASYKASEFRVDVDSPRPSYVRGETAVFETKAEYLYGAPMGGASVHNAASRSVTSFAPPGSDDFVTTDDVSTGDYADTSPRAEELEVKDGDLDAEGRAYQSIPLDMPGQRSPEMVRFEAQVEDVSRQTVAQSAAVLVHPAPFYVGLRKPPGRFFAVGATLKPEVVAFEPSGTHRAGVPMRVELVSRVWTDVAIDEAASVPRHTTKLVDTVVASCDALTSKAVAGCALRVPTAGYFILRATSAGPVVRSSTGLYALDDRADAPPAVGWSDDGARGLRIETDKETYASGDTAKILVRSPFKEADALVTVERAGVLWQEVAHLRGAMPVVSVPMKPEYYPNVFVGIQLVRGRVAPMPAPGLADLGAPDFRTAYKEVAIAADSHRLKVDIAPSKLEVHPGEELDADVRVAGADGRGLRAAVTFYAVDEGVLMLTSYKTPDPLPAFAEHKRLADFGIESRERLAHFLPLRNGERIPIAGYELEPAPEAEKEMASMADKGENGGGGDGSPLRADFRTTAYFEAGRATSEEGRTRFHFKLPDNLTRFRLMAVVASSDDRFGFGESTITSSRDLMARPALPRVLRVGDAFDASVVVSSKSPAARQVTVTLDAKGLTLAAPRTKTIALGSNGQGEVRFPATVVQPGSAELTFAVSSGGQGDRVLVRRPVELPVDLRSAAVYGETTGDLAIALDDFKSAVPDVGSLKVRLATTALVGIDSAFDQLSEYPYGCTEQLTSRALPLLALDDMARAFHVRVPERSHDALDDAVGALLSHQHGSGGFGYWEDDPEVPWLSAYAMWGLEEASKKGFYVPPSALERGVEYLRNQLSRRGGADSGESASSGESANDEPRTDDAPPAPDPEADGFTAAFIADVLATLGAPDPGALDREYEGRRDLGLAAQALLLHAMAAAHLHPAELQTLARDVQQRLRVAESFAVADDAGDDRRLDSTARTTALVLRALVAVDPKHPLASRLARGLLDLRRGGAWRSTQENLWALVALEDYRKAQENGPTAADVETFLGAESLGIAAFRAAQDVDSPIDVPMSRVMQSAVRTLSFSVRPVSGAPPAPRVFYAAEATYASRELPSRPDDSGFFVQRIVRAVKPNDLPAALKSLPRTGGVARATAGDLVLVDLLVESAEPRDQVVLSDPLPAGIEAIDFDLDTSSRVEEVSDSGTERIAKRGGLLGYGAAFAEAEGVHREVHDDRVLTFARHLDPGMYHFRYLARATSIGHFVVPPAEIRCMYSPEVTGRTAATTFDVVAEARTLASR